MSIYSILKPEDKKNIAKLYGVHPKYLYSWLLSLVEIRNKCAHYNRLYNIPLKQKPLMFKEHQKYVKSNTVKLFPAILIMRRISNANSVWMQFYEKLVILMKEYNKVVQLSFIGFPDDWEEVLQEPLHNNQ